MALSHAAFKPTSRGISSNDIIRLSFVLLLVFSLVLSADMAGFTASQNQLDTTRNNSGRYAPGSYMPGEVVVKFKEPASGTRVNNMGIDPTRLLQDSVNTSYGLTGYAEIAGMPGYYRYLAGKDSDIEKLVAAISLNPDVQYAEPNYIIHANSTTSPDDPLYTQAITDTSGFPQSRQYYLSKIGISALWNVITGTTVTIAVLDTGVNPLHQDLCLNDQNGNPPITYTTAASSNSGFTSFNPYDTFCAKYDWTLGYNFIDPSPHAGALDDNGHGTAVAGIIAATTNNTLGIAGINWNASILPVKVLDATKSGSDVSVSQGIKYAADKNARIINMSWSQETTTPSQLLVDSVNYAQAKGSLIVAGAGIGQNSTINPFPPGSSGGTKSYPAALPGVVGVGATDETDHIIENYGNYISVVAPGKDILTTYCDFVTPKGKPSTSKIINTVQGASFLDTNNIIVTPITVTNQVTNYAYQNCENPAPQRYPITGLTTLCTDGSSCFFDDTQRGLKPSDPSTVDSGIVIGNDGFYRRTITTTVTLNQADIKSYDIYVDGSSYSAAVVSGLSSLIVSANPSLTNDQIKKLLEASTDQLNAVQVGTSNQGNGRINAAKIANFIVQGGGVIPQPPAASGVRGVVTGFGNPTDIELNLDPVNRTVSPNPDGGFLFDNLAAGTYYLRLHVKSSGMIMGPVKIMLTGAVGEEFHITFDITNNKLYCGSGSVCPGDVPGAGSGQTAFAPASPIAGSLYFNETGHNISNGFRDYWVANGGLAIFGYPLSEEFTEVSPTDGRTYIVQYFQRNRFEYHPENQPPYKVLLGLLGSESTHERGFVPVDPIDPTSTAIYFKETGHTLKNQFLTYWQSHGGLAIFGYPISEAFQDGQYYVQYFQRNRFELHPENFGTPYEVLLGLLGTDLARARGYLP